MFAEELSGSRSRKRQEEARSRRRQLKQQQQNAKATEEQTNSAILGASSESLGVTQIGSSQRNTKEAPATPSSVGPTISSTSTRSKKPSAVEHALQQRWLRQELHLRQTSATVIQSFYRAHRSNVQLLANQASLLSKRLTDVATLRTLLSAKTSTEYVPPPATVTSLTIQMLFVTRTIPYRRRTPRTAVLRSHNDATSLQRVLEYLILPGIVGSDENLDPALTWVSSGEGHTRFIELMRLCFVVATKKFTPAGVLSTIVLFLRTVLGVASDRTARGAVVQEARYILPAVPYEEVAFSELGSPLDLIRILRHHLMFGSGPPIPGDASKGRDACFPAKERAQNDALFHITLDAIQMANAGSERTRLLNRFVADVFTVPLLSWRLSSAMVARLVKIEADDGERSSPSNLIVAVSSFVENNAVALSAGKIALVLSIGDVPLTSCPATNTQCLLANLAQLGRICPSVNGSNPDKMDYHSAEVFFKLLATLIDAVPLGTFSSRDSAVEWISDGKSHHTPIVLSPVIIEQCKSVLVNSFVRDLFAAAIDNDRIGTENVLREKNDKDLKHERELTEVGTSSAATLAAKEARIDRNRNFWKSSKWARKLGQGMSKFLSSDKKPGQPAAKGPGQLMDTSSMSRKLAHGKDFCDRNVTSTILSSKVGSTKKCEPATIHGQGFLIALCRMYGTIISRWGGGGRDDIVKQKVNDEHRPLRLPEHDRGDATAVADPCTLSLLNVLSFSTSFVQTSWALVQSDSSIVAGIYSVIDATKSSTPIRSLTIRPTYGAVSSKSKGGVNDGAVVLYLFVCTFVHTLIITDDVELHDMDQPIPVHQVRRCVQLLKKLLYRACLQDDTESLGGHLNLSSNHFGLSLVSSSSRTMRDLYDRSSRRPLCIPKLWIVEDLLDKDIRRCKTASEYEALLASPVLRICPFLVTFKRRLKLFERIVTTNRVEIQGENSQNPFHPGLKPGIPVRITRGRVLEDGLLTLNKLGRNLRQRIAVQYVSETGAQETGVDVGGLFKDFWTDLSHIAFDPTYALFRVTEGAGNCLYPNPSSAQAHGPDHIVLFQFLGRILGKALFEGITIHPRFAHFFLSFIRGDYNFLHMLPDLSTLDPQLYHNLMFLKNYDGDAEDLCLSFTVADDEFGLNKETVLIPNGSDVAVTNANKLRYIGLVAKHNVCDRVKDQSEAFTRGLWDVIDRSWLRIFNEPELQVLISGATDGKLDVADMRTNARYAGGYTGLDRNIQRFWRVVSSFSSKQQGDLLRFATSCERPPPLGFSSMNPPFTIQRVGILRDGDKLPTASTCFNVLKLPTYSSEKVLRERLLYAIEAGAGFELM